MQILALIQGEPTSNENQHASPPQHHRRRRRPAVAATAASSLSRVGIENDLQKNNKKKTRATTRQMKDTPNVL